MREVKDVSTDVVGIVLLSTLAGLGTGLGGLAVLVRKPGEKLLVFLIGLASGLMIMVSFMELLLDSLSISGLLPASAGFIGGSLVLFFLDFILPHKHIVSEKGVIDAKMFRTGTLIAIGISIHNLPEGVAVASGYSFVPEIGLIIAIAIAIHNIPEGIAIALPIRMSGASRWAAFRVALLSGLIEPVGAAIATVFLTTSPELMPFALSFAAGVMVFITVDELIPLAHEHGNEHFTSFGIIIGFILALGLLILIK
jgi:ZIP family zinc transporter